MVNVVAVAIVTLVIMIIGGGLGYLIYLRTRPKKEVWKAQIYQLGKGVRPPVKDKDNNIISDIEVLDLIPYAKDVVEKIEKDPGIVIYRLQKMNKVCPPITSNVVDYWGEKDARIDLLLHDGEVAILDKGYNKTTGEKTFTPISQTKLNLIKSEMAIRKDRLRPTKDILSAITPWIVTAICMLGLISVAYMIISGFVDISDNLKVASENWVKVSENFNVVSKQVTQIEEIEKNNLVKQNETPKPKPPLVDGQIPT